MKKLLPMAVLATIALVLTFPPLRGGEKKADDSTLVHPYFPLKVGTTWEYRSGGQQRVVKVAAHETIDGMLCARLETEMAAGKVTEHLTVKDGKLYRVRAQNQEIKPPVLLLWLSPDKDKSWEIDSTVQTFPLKGKLQISEEKLTIGKTEYDTVCVKSSGDLMLDKRKMTMQTWYAKDKGMVKQITRLPEAEVDIMLELDKFTLGK